MILDLLALVGATLIVAQSTLFRVVRKLWPVFLGCPQCVGFWVGAAAGGLGFVRAGHGFFLDAFVVGCVTSFIAMVADGILFLLLGEPTP